MREYLTSIINETIERAQFLKLKIKFPLKYSELTGLANRCVTILDDQIYLLRNILKNKENYPERSAWRNVRDCIRIIEGIEKWGIPSLYNQTEDVGILNKITFAIHQEINLPLEPPPVSILSTDYYYTAPFVDVIFVPLSEAGFLLHLSDLYHEIGHYVSKNKGEKKLEGIGKGYLMAYEEIVEKFDKIVSNKSRERGPEKTLLRLQNYQVNWANNWLEEFFCDLFALYLLGPAYAWSHLHLVTKKNLNIYLLYSFSEQTHPSDEARIQMMLIGLRLLGLDSISKDIEEKWREIMKSWGEPPVEYLDAYPTDLLCKVAFIILNAMKSANFNLISSEIIKNENSNSIGSILNQAWQKFWLMQPNEYRKWEISKLKELELRFFANN